MGLMGADTKRPTDEQHMSGEDSVVQSLRKEPRRWFMQEEKGKEKMSDYNFGYAELDSSEFDFKPIEKASTEEVEIGREGSENG